LGRIDLQIEKLEAKLKHANGGRILGLFGHRDSDKLGARVAQLKESRVNIKRFGQETVPTGNPAGAELGLPNAED
jgi:hypothetical protein